MRVRRGGKGEELRRSDRSQWTDRARLEKEEWVQ